MPGSKPTTISLGSSKLYHYFYPYVPPLALAGGYGVAWLARAVLRAKQGGICRLRTGGPVEIRQGDVVQIGDPVRIIRDPLFGKIGQVSALPPDLQKIPTESEVRVLEVTFEDGSHVVIPRTNIEVIEGV